jgi:uncharacterized membrane protein YhhN
VSIEFQTVILSTLCLVAAASYIVASWAEKPFAAALSKTVASTSFIVLALSKEASESVYGRFVLVALILCWCGDIFLLSRQNKFLLSGIVAFFFAHVAFVSGFLQLSLDFTYFLIALVCTSAAGSLILRWLWKYLEGSYKGAIAVYILVMVIMASLAIAATEVPLIGVAAILFAISDVSVARDRFVSRDIVNKAWGLPLYYTAQLLFAASVITVV